jgi:hypothetical protein
MAVPKGLALWPSNLLTMLAMPFSNSTATTGKAVPSRFVRIASLALDPASVEAVLALEEDLVEVSVLGAADSVVADSTQDSEVVVVDLCQAMVVEELVTMEELALFLQPPTPSPTMLLQAPREARLFTFATLVPPFHISSNVVLMRLTASLVHKQ